jgi:integrase
MASRTKKLVKEKSKLTDQKLVGRVELITEGLPPFVRSAMLTRVSDENTRVITDYLTDMSTINPSNNYRANTVKTLYLLSANLNNKSFRLIKREDILQYLNSGKKSEDVDPLHKWVGTYNMKRMVLLRFFKWLHYPKLNNSQRKKADLPPVFQNITQLKRKEKSIYRPTDMWSQEDDLLFLKYCPNKRDRCYHIMSRDTGCRPHELTKLRIKDVVFKLIGEHQVAEIVVNGKTGSRTLPLIFSIPYLKDWIDSHPQKGNSRAFLFPTMQHQRLCRQMGDMGLNQIYARYKEVFFPRLLRDPNVPSEDKEKIRALLEKPWNPYVRRHSALTEKSLMLPDYVLKQYAGWTMGSQMHNRYLHYMANQTNEKLYEAYGLIKKGKEVDQLRPKECPHCGAANERNNNFCTNEKCKMPLSLEAYQSVKQETQKDIETMQQQMTRMGEDHKRDMEELRSLIAHNPRLANVKPEELLKARRRPSNAA